MSWIAIILCFDKTVPFHHDFLATCCVCLCVCNLIALFSFIQFQLCTCDFRLRSTAMPAPQNDEQCKCTTVTCGLQFQSCILEHVYCLPITLHHITNHIRNSITNPITYHATYHTTSYYHIILHIITVVTVEYNITISLQIWREWVVIMLGVTAEWELWEVSYRDKWHERACKGPPLTCQDLLRPFWGTSIWPPVLWPGPSNAEGCQQTGRFLMPNFQRRDRGWKLVDENDEM